MNTKNRQFQESHSPHCSRCERPILPGPGFDEESKAGLHRDCFRTEAHQEAITSQAHEIWLEAFGVLYTGLFHDQTALLKLFCGCQKPGTTIRSYLDCLTQAMSLIKNSPLGEENKASLSDRIEALQTRIRQLSAGRAN